MIKRGFSLVELLIVLAIFSVISIAVFTLGKDTFFFNDIIQSSFNTQEEAKRVIRPMATELRAARQSAAGAYPIDTAGTSTIVFYSDINGDGNTEKVRYFLSSTTIKRGIIVPTGSPLGYTGSESLSELVHGVRNNYNQPVFEYFDSSYTGTSSPLTQPVSISSIRLVKVNIIIDMNVNRSPVQQTVTTQAEIRNLKDNL